MIYCLQAVCEEIRRLAPKVGLHHDGVVFGSDDFCASIGSYYTLGLTFFYSLSATQVLFCLSFSGFVAENIGFY